MPRVMLPIVSEYDALDPSEIDISVAHPARMYNYYLGGKTHFAADREAAEKVLAVLPEGRDMAIANRAFLGRAVRFLAREGITQFLDIGTGIPSPGNTGEVLGNISPGARVVYIDNDPIVITHSRALLRDGGLASAVHRDLRDVDGLLADPGIKDALDFGRPIAVLLVAVLHFIRDREEPARIVRALRDAMPSGSYLVISHGTQDFNPARATAAVRGYDQAAAPFVLRSREDIEGFFDGLDLVEPGIVQLPFWRADGDNDGDPSKIWLYAGVGHKQ
jgi:S-adenosyl methyltransferase